MEEPVFQPQAEYPFDRPVIHIPEKRPFLLKNGLKIHSPLDRIGKQEKAGGKIAKALPAGKEAEVQPKEKDQGQGKRQEPGPGKEHSAGMDKNQAGSRTAQKNMELGPKSLGAGENSRAPQKKIEKSGNHEDQPQESCKRLPGRKMITWVTQKTPEQKGQDNDPGPEIDRTKFHRFSASTNS
jgi:hypothetical protein